jgi:hypothetical protein
VEIQRYAAGNNNGMRGQDSTPLSVDWDAIDVDRISASYLGLFNRQAGIRAWKHGVVCDPRFRGNCVCWFSFRRMERRGKNACITKYFVLESVPATRSGTRLKDPRLDQDNPSIFLHPP